MRATKADFASLKRLAWSEFRHPDRMDLPFLRWCDRVILRAAELYGARLPMIVTSDGRTYVPAGGSKTSAHLFNPADPLDTVDAIDFRYPWLSVVGGKTDGTKLAAITEAVVTTPRPAGRGFEFGIEHGAPAGPHLHLALRRVPQNWLFAR